MQREKLKVWRDTRNGRRQIRERQTKQDIFKFSYLLSLKQKINYFYQIEENGTCSKTNEDVHQIHSFINNNS